MSSIKSTPRRLSTRRSQLGRRPSPPADPLRMPRLRSRRWVERRFWSPHSVKARWPKLIRSDLHACRIRLIDLALEQVDRVAVSSITVLRRTAERSVVSVDAGMSEVTDVPDLSSGPGRCRRRAGRRTSSGAGRGGRPGRSGRHRYRSSSTPADGNQSWAGSYREPRR